MCRTPDRARSARIKLGLLASTIVLNTWVAIPWLSGALLLIGLCLIALWRVPWRSQMLFLLTPLWPAVVVLAGFSIGFGITPLARLGPVTLYQEGFWRGCQVGVRAYCDVAWLVWSMQTTSLPDVLAALRWYRMPSILVETLSMMYRYSFLLSAEFQRMRGAAAARGGHSGLQKEMVSISRIVSQVFMRAYDRSDRICVAMAARGGNLT